MPFYVIWVRLVIQLLPMVNDFSGVESLKLDCSRDQIGRLSGIVNHHIQVISALINYPVMKLIVWMIGKPN
jgi:hypothetical protein